MMFTMDFFVQRNSVILLCRSRTDKVETKLFSMYGDLPLQVSFKAATTSYKYPQSFLGEMGKGRERERETCQYLPTTLPNSWVKITCTSGRNFKWLKKIC